MPYIKVLLKIYYIVIMYFCLYYSFLKKRISICIVIRINKATANQLARYLEWRKDFPKNFHFYILSMKYLNISILRRFKIYNIAITFTEITSNYPNITTLKGNCSSFKNQKLLSWISHSESIIIFCKKTKLKYDFIWIIEQDVGFVGNLYKFISLYRYNLKDLITIGVGKITPKWIWFNCATSKYISRRYIFFNNSHGFINREYVQRWSRLYIKKMMIDLKNSYHSQSETSSFELVLYHNLSYETIPKKYIGSPLHAGESLTKLIWFNISKNELYYNKFFHPLKF